MNVRSEPTALNTRPTDFDPRTGTIIGIRRGHGKRENEADTRFVGEAAALGVLKSPHCGKNSFAPSMAIR
jgi:hypothetical protein